MSQHKNDDGTINLKRAHEEEQDDDAEFRISPVEANEIGESISSAFEGEALKNAEGNPDGAAKSPYDKIKIKFDKFVNLIATHAYEDILEDHEDDDIIISTNLLTDLANAHEETKSDKKVPILFILGIILGVAITYYFVKY